MKTISAQLLFSLPFLLLSHTPSPSLSAIAFSVWLFPFFSLLYFFRSLSLLTLPLYTSTCTPFDCVDFGWKFFVPKYFFNRFYNGGGFLDVEMQFREFEWDIKDNGSCRLIFFKNLFCLQHQKVKINNSNFRFFWLYTLTKRVFFVRDADRKSVV